MEVVIVDDFNPCLIKPGGTRTYSLNLIRKLRNKVNFSLIGFSDQDNLKNGAYSFIPIVKSKDVSGYKYLLNLFLKAPSLGIPESAILHFHRVDKALPFLLFYRKNPKILTIHGRNYKMEFVKRKGLLTGGILEIIALYVIKKMDKIIFVDESSKNFCKLPGDKSIVIPIGIDINIFKPMDINSVRNKYNFNINDKIILYVGRFSKEKGLDLLIKAFIIVQNKMPNCNLVLVGNGQEKQNLIKLVNDNKLRNVQFMDVMEHKEIPEIMNIADVFALCSIYEGMPTVVIEALACGVPVVSTDVGDVHKVVLDNKTGYIVKSRTEDAIAAKLIEALNNNNNLKEICVKKAQRYSWEKIAEEIKGVYDEFQKK